MKIKKSFQDYFLLRSLILLLFFLSTVVLLLFSCQGSNKKAEIAEIVKAWQGKEIVFPSDLVFTKHGKDTIDYAIPASDHKIIMYVDSVGCTSCKLQLHKWKTFVSELDSLTGGTVPVLFFFHPKDRHEISYLLKRDGIDIPVCIDGENKINAVNRFPEHQAFQCFLLDRENKVICIGNPVHNLRIKEMYLAAISEGGYSRVAQPSGNTRIEADKTVFDLGGLKKGDTRTVCVTIRNIGELPFVIYDVKTSCGCVHIDYAKKPVAPNGTAEINITYHADDSGVINKTLSVYGNTDASPLTVRFKGEVNTN